MSKGSFVRKRAYPRSHRKVRVKVPPGSLKLQNPLLFHISFPATMIEIIRFWPNFRGMGLGTS
jgi:hypothetical protein